jgi:hypothetical protein
MPARALRSPTHELPELATHSIIGGPDKWALLLALAEPSSFEPSRQRPDFSVTNDESAVDVYPLRIDTLTRLDDIGQEWAFCGRVDKDADFDNYDSDGCHRQVRGIYNTESRLGKLTIL